MRRILLIFLVCCATLVSSYSVDFDFRNDTSPRLSEPRLMFKSLNLLYNLYKMFSPLKSSEKEINVNSRHDLVPINGIFRYGDPNNRRVTTIDRFPTLAELNKEEGIMEPVKPMTDVKKDEPEFWLFDKFSKRVDLLYMAKILLKIIIFKKIVKFIALVCLLFFIPALNDNSSTDESRDSKNLDFYGNSFLIERNLM